MEKKKHVTGFLFSDPSLLSGAGTVMNLAGNFYEYNGSENGEEADKVALENDFQMVGQDIAGVMDAFYTEHLQKISAF